MNSIRIAVGETGVIEQTPIDSIVRSSPDFPLAGPSGAVPAARRGCRDPRLRHMGDVITGKAAPEASLAVGLENMCAMEAPRMAAREKQLVEIDAAEEIGTPDLIQTKGRI